MSARDPAVEDAMRMVFLDGFKKGYEQGTRRQSIRVFINGCVTGCLLALMLAAKLVFAQAEIPIAANEYRRDLTRIARSVWGPDAPISTLAAQIHQESYWRTNVRSHAGAEGIAQFMPGTARGLAAQYGEIARPFDPRWAFLAQSRYMRDIYERQSAMNECERFAFTLSAYNGGERWVQRRKSLSPQPERCLGATCDINPGITASNQRENRGYSRRILLQISPLYYEAGWGLAHCSRYGASE